MRTESSHHNYAFKASFYDRFFKSLPNKDIVNAEKFNKIGHALASPHWNRLALGCAAICSQPMWDYFNPKVDNDTAKASAIRTGSKIVVCTSVGFTIRGLAHKIVKKLANGTPEEGSTLLTPKEILSETNIAVRNSKLKLHRNAFSTLLALSVMMFTNFLIDAPLTTLVANKILKKSNMNNKSEGNKNV